MKYNIRFCLYTLIHLCVLSGCSFLEESPETSPTEKDIYATEDGARSVLTGCYQALTSGPYYGVWAYEISYNSIWLASVQAMGVYYGGRIGDKNPTDTGITSAFDGIYTLVTRTNDLLANIDSAPISSELIEHIKGEAYFLRAYAYFDLVRLFGRVPLIKTPILTPDQISVPRTSLREIYRSILDDLTQAERMMPTKEEQLLGRPHAMAATALKAKVYFSMASLTKDHFDATKEPEAYRYSAEEQRQFYQDSYDCAMTVVKSGAYSLLLKYADLWNKRTENTDEAILEVQFSSSYGQNCQMTARTGCKSGVFSPNYRTNTLAGRIRASRVLFAEHWVRHGNGKAVNEISSNNETGVDPRINVNYLYFNDYRSDTNEGGSLHIYPNMVSLNKVEEIFPYLRKHWYDAFNGTGDKNFIAFRYADLLLTLAEAANELDKPGEAVYYVNMILDRAADENGNGVRDAGEIQPIAWDENSMDKTQIREELRYERVFELAGEGVEHFEFRRYGIDHMRSLLSLHDYWRSIITKPIADGGWGKTGNMHKGDPAYGNVSDDFLRANIYFPYPRTQIQLNDAISEEDQNLGWEYQ